MSKRTYIETGKISIIYSFRIPFIEQDIDLSWDFTLLKISIHDMRRTPEHKDNNNGS